MEAHPNAARSYSLPDCEPQMQLNLAIGRYRDEFGAWRPQTCSSQPLACIKGLVQTICWHLATLVCNVWLSIFSTQLQSLELLGGEAAKLNSQSIKTWQGTLMTTDIYRNFDNASFTREPVEAFCCHVPKKARGTCRYLRPL